ncbi:hypothetical protein [Kitasatospora sp. A2-31]|uniref:hypothetical protein n=1 Tax=Kitasatospora sp. A2-31 TaxID=2916414 RepID=UPI001EE9A772|nr:hypothetical protein [Kitasatospora sp. A2-31]MCG6492931.1 hypothetical protein [Kitasatospora sp. A2-31]
MPIVFVHGVGNHDEQQFELDASFRRRFFADFLLPAIGADPEQGMPLFPWWGRVGALPRWGRVCHPDAAEYLGSSGEASLLQELAAADPPATGWTENVVLDTARESVADAVDLLYSALDLEACDGEELNELAALAVPLASYCENDPDELFWEDVGDDLDLITAFVETAQRSDPELETLGGGGPLEGARKRLLEAAETMNSALGARPTRLVADGLRRLTDPVVHDYLGDVFAYLTLRGTRDCPGEIVSIVLHDLQQAADAAPDREPLVVVAHSMGGNIVYDIASYFAPELQIDVLVTVGSQPGLFAEFSAFPGVPRDLPKPGHGRVPARENVRTWINVVDRSDMLSYSAEPVFEGVQDVRYESGALWAHSAYFKQPNFHARLAKRVKAATT